MSARRRVLPAPGARLIIVGAGPAGLATAVAAAERGAQVLVLDKASEIGGTARVAVGSVSASCTSLQAAAGVDDSPELHERDLGLLAGADAIRDNAAFRRILAHESGPTFEWLRYHGVDFFGPIQEEPHSRPRMHVALPGAAAYVSRLHRAARKLGVRFELGVRVLEVVTDERGRVWGVTVLREAKELFVRATLGVVLASGDFSASEPLKRRYLGPGAAQAPGINPHSTGDGHRIASRVGATVVNSDMAMSPQLRFAPPKRAELLRRIPAWRPMTCLLRFVLPRVPRGLMSRVFSYYLTSYMAPSLKLLTAGARVVDDAGRLLPADPDLAVEELARGQRTGYLVMSSTIARKFEAWPNYVSTAPGVAYAYMSDYERLRPDLLHRGASPSEVTREVEVVLDAATLRGLDRWFNCGEDNPTPLVHASSRYERFRGLVWRRQPAANARYIALGPVRSWSVLTDGGLRVLDDHRVVGHGGDPVEGLYAVGAVGQSGVVLNGHGHHLMWAFVSGCRVGRALASQAASRTPEAASERGRPEATSRSGSGHRSNTAS